MTFAPASQPNKYFPLSFVLKRRLWERDAMNQMISSAITTAEQLAQAGDLGPCELVAGEIVPMSPSGHRHSWIAGRVLTKLNVYLETSGLGGRVTGADGGYLLTRNPDTVRAPDVGYVKAERSHDIVTGYFEGAPDLAVEVISPTDTWREMSEKIEQWLAAGCSLVWVIDPELQTATEFRRDAPQRKFRPGEPLSGKDVVPGFQLPLEKIFS
jgi:Uma2 family endonuclease